MIPNMYKIAGELTPAVMHVAARSVATHALSIFGDHSRRDGVPADRALRMLALSSVQEAHDLALIAQAATLRSRVPFLHFFDGFRTSHEVNKIEHARTTTTCAHDRRRTGRRASAAGRSTPDRPVIRGTAQNPDMFFQAREAVNPFYDAAAGRGARRRWIASRSGPAGNIALFDYVGDPDAERVIVMMGSGRRPRRRPSANLRRAG